MRFPRHAQFILCFTKFVDRFAEHAPQFRELLGAEEHQGQDEDDNHLLKAKGSHMLLFHDSPVQGERGACYYDRRLCYALLLRFSRSFYASPHSRFPAKSHFRTSTVITSPLRSTAGLFPTFILAPPIRNHSLRLCELPPVWWSHVIIDRKSTRLNSSHVKISYAVFCL